MSTDPVVRRAAATASLPPGPDGRLVVAHLDTSEVYHLDATGAAIWLAVDGRRNAGGIAVAVAERLGVPSSALVEPSCRDFVGELLRLGLIEHVDP